MKSANPLQFVVNSRGLPYELAVKVAKLAEKVGFAMMTCSDRPTEDIVEGWTLATAVGIQTEKLMVTHGTINVPYRKPTLLAKMAASLDNITGGRFVVTLGSGWPENLYTPFGFNYGTPKERFADLKDAVEIMRGMWANETFTYRGERLSDYM